MGVQVQLEVVLTLLQRGANANARNGKGETPLHMACCQGHLDVAQNLILHGAEIEAGDKHGRTPLLRACKKSWDTVKLLVLDQDANVNVSGPDGIIPLHVACMYGNPKDVLEILLATGANIMAKDRIYIDRSRCRGFICARFAGAYGHVELARKLRNTFDLVRAVADCQTTKEDMAIIATLCWKEVFVHVCLPEDPTEFIFDVIRRHQERAFHALVAIVHKEIDMVFRSQVAPNHVVENHWHVGMLRSFTRVDFESH